MRNPRVGKGVKPLPYPLPAILCQILCQRSSARPSVSSVMDAHYHIAIGPLYRRIAIWDGSYLVAIGVATLIPDSYSEIAAAICADSYL